MSDQVESAWPTLFSMIEWTRPWYLVTLLVALPWLFWLFRRSLSDFPVRQRCVSLAVRSLVVLLLALALAGSTWLHSTHEPLVVCLVDQSLSIGTSGRERSSSFLLEFQEAAKGHRVAFLPFGATPGKLMDEIPVFDPVPSLITQLDSAVPKSNRPEPQIARNPLQEGTNLASALEVAAGSFPVGYVPRLVVLTDGNETSGDALQTVLRHSIPVSTVELPIASEPEVQIAEIKTPPEVREGEPFQVEVVVQSNHDDEGLLEIYRGDHKVLSERRTLKSGENRFQFQQSIQRDRLANFTVRVSELKGDTLLDNNAESSLVYAAGKPRVLLIESDPALIRELAFALEDEGIQVDIRPPQGMPETLADLQNYEVLILSNVPATAITQRQMEIARVYVQELGGGFMMLGGEQSFGLGGYFRSTLEEILPVRSDFEKEKEKPSLAMALVIDKSGSMGGDKLEMAKSAAQNAVELLGQRDKVGVIAFDGDSYVISEMQSLANKASILDEIARIEVGGGTTMYPAMEMAHDVLVATSAKLKHVIILTDGISSPGDFQGIAQQMASAKITVSTVAVGEGADEALLEEISQIGKGRYYFAADPSMVPQIFAKETVTVSKSAINEQPFVPQVVRASHALSGIDMGSAPFLLGYVVTRPKPTCEVILATEQGDPLLVWWRYGLGMTTAFTSDAKSRWAAEWMTWPGFGKFWTQVVRQTMRKADARGIGVQTQRKGSLVDVDVDAVDSLGRFLNEAAVEITVVDPQLRRESVAMTQSAPGRYQAHLRAPASGAYHLEITAKQEGSVLYQQSRGITVGYSDELRIRPPNSGLLKRMTEVSGGAYNPTASQLFAPSNVTAQRPTPLWPYLVAAAVVLFVLDVALRRIDFTQ